MRHSKHSELSKKSSIDSSSSISSAVSLSTSISSLNEFDSDAVNCHACGTGFNLIHRRHHCRICKFSYCGSCSSGRILVAGYGDARVRVCDDCKAEADRAKFEARKSRAEKRPAFKSDDELLEEFLGFEKVNVQGRTDSVQRPLYKKETAAELTDLLNATWEGKPTQNSKTEKSGRENNETVAESQESNAPSGSVQSAPEFTAEELREQAKEQKTKASKLRKDGLTEAAHRAFKKAKELEKQAEQLEPAVSEPAVQVRSEAKSKRPSSSKLLQSKEATAPAKGKKSNTDSDFMDDLKELGWSDDAAPETSRKLPPEPSAEPSSAPDQTTKTGLESEIRRIKLNALALKRQGNLTEAVAELKKAKMLEKQIEEMEMLGDSASDNEMDEEDIDLPSLDDEPVVASKPTSKLDLDINQIARLGEIDEHVDVDDADMDDPDLGAALKEMGWDGDDGHHESKPPAVSPAVIIKPPPNDRESMEKEALEIKRNALKLKREGKVAEALAELKRAKIIEKKLEEMDMAGDDEEEEEDMDLTEDADVLTHSSSKMMISSDPKAPIDLDFVSRIGNEVEDDDVDVDVDDSDLHDPDMVSALKEMGWEEDKAEKTEKVEKKQGVNNNGSVIAVEPKEKKESLSEKKVRIQNEIISLKQSALGFKRAGKIAEATSQLKKAKVLEMQLEEMEEEEEDDVEVTEEDENDPELLAALSGMGWKEEKKEVKPPLIQKTPAVLQQVRAPAISAQEKTPVASTQVKTVVPITEDLAKVSDTTPVPEPVSSPESLREEVHSGKIRAVNLKKEGRLQEAKEEYVKVKLLEKRLTEMESSQTKPVPEESITVIPLPTPALHASMPPAISQTEPPAVKTVPVIFHPEPVTSISGPATSIASASSLNSGSDLTSASGSSLQEVSIPDGGAAIPLSIDELGSSIHEHKVKALTFKREGMLSEAMDELKKAKMLEITLSETVLSSSPSPSPPTPPMPSSVQVSNQTNAGGEMNITGKNILNQINYSSIQNNDNNNNNYKSGNYVDNNVDNKKNLNGMQKEESNMIKSNMQVEKDVGSKNNSMTGVNEIVKEVGNKEEASSVNEKSEKIEMSESEIRENIKKHKLQALTLKREGKLAEASQELKLAKQLELQLSVHKEDSLPVNTTGAAPVSSQENRLPVGKVDSLPVSGSVSVYGLPVKSNEVPVNQTASASSTVQKVNGPDFISNLEKELRMHESRATTLVIQGNFQEAEKEAKEAMRIQKQIDDIQKSTPQSSSLSQDSLTQHPHQSNRMNLSETTTNDGKISAEPFERTKSSGLENASNVSQNAESEPVPNESSGSGGVDMSVIENEIKKFKLQAFNFKKEGDMASAKEALMQAKLLERKFMSSSNSNLSAAPSKPASSSVDASNSFGNTSVNRPVGNVSASAPLTPDSTVLPSPEPGKEIASLKQQVVDFKRKALTLKREGKLDEAREALKQARTLEAQVEAMSGSASGLASVSSVPSQQPSKPIQVATKPVRRIPISRPAVDTSLNDDDDLFDAKLMANLKSLGL